MAAQQRTSVVRVSLASLVGGATQRCLHAVSLVMGKLASAHSSTPVTSSVEEWCKNSAAGLYRAWLKGQCSTPHDATLPFSWIWRGCDENGLQAAAE